MSSTRLSSTTRDRSTGASGDSRLQRVLEGTGFVAVWVLLGYLLPVGDDTYLLLGVPLTVGFQLLVRRRPLRELWVPDTGRLALDRRGLVLAALLVLTPGYFGLQALAAGDWPGVGWYAAAVVGAGCAAFALRETSVVAMIRSAALPLAIGAGGMVAVLGGIHVATGTPVHLLAVLGAVAKYLALYFPATFVLEEVAFRGALDAHVHHAGEGRGWESALLVSALWGLWHLPISLGQPLPVLVAELLAVHVLLGVPLSFAWRRSGNLAGPALAHSAIDGVRNALLLGL